MNCLHSYSQSLSQVQIKKNKRILSVSHMIRNLWPYVQLQIDSSFCSVQRVGGIAANRCTHKSWELLEAGALLLPTPSWSTFISYAVRN